MTKSQQTSYRLPFVAYLLAVSLGVFIFFPSPDPTTSSILEASTKLIGHIVVMSIPTITVIFAIEKVIL